MKFHVAHLLFLALPIVANGQVDSTSFYNAKKLINKEINDTSKENKLSKHHLPPRSLIIKTKDLKEIKYLTEKPFMIIDDTIKFSADELSSGLSETELCAYKKNKDETKNILVPPPSEEEAYPLITKVRKILGAAQTIGAIVIFILCL